MLSASEKAITMPVVRAVVGNALHPAPLLDMEEQTTPVIEMSVEDDGTKTCTIDSSEAPNAGLDECSAGAFVLHPGVDMLAFLPSLEEALHIEELLWSTLCFPPFSPFHAHDCGTTIKQPEGEGLPPPPPSGPPPPPPARHGDQSLVVPDDVWHATTAIWAGL